MSTFRHGLRYCSGLPEISAKGTVFRNDGYESPAYHLLRFIGIQFYVLRFSVALSRGHGLLLLRLRVGPSGHAEAARTVPELSYGKRAVVEYGAMSMIFTVMHYRK